MKSIFGNHHFWVHLSENDSLKDLHTGQLYLNVRIGAAGPLQIIFQTVHGESRRVIPLIITLLDKNTLIKRLSCLLIKATTKKSHQTPFCRISKARTLVLVGCPQTCQPDLHWNLFFKNAKPAVSHCLRSIADISQAKGSGNSPAAAAAWSESGTRGQKQAAAFGFLVLQRD